MKGFVTRPCAYSPTDATAGQSTQYVEVAGADHGNVASLEFDRINTWFKMATTMPMMMQSA